jgi:hypothetical protein
VIGGSYPVAVAAGWLATVWDQDAALPVMSPVAARLHEVVTGWLADLLGLPTGTAAAFVSGASMANTATLAAARDHQLARVGWDVQAGGLFGAPELTVVIGEKAHGVALVRRPGDLRRSFAAAAGYLPPDTGFEATNHTPQSSQRARQVEVWAVLRTLGRAGVTDLITCTCRSWTACQRTVIRPPRVSGEAVGFFDRLGEVERRLLGQVVADAAGEGPVHVLAGEPRGVGGGIGVRRTVRVALERDRRHRDRREGREPLLDHVELWFAGREP